MKKLINKLFGSNKKESTKSNIPKNKRKFAFTFNDVDYHIGDRVRILSPSCKYGITAVITSDTKAGCKVYNLTALYSDGLVDASKIELINE